MRNITPYVKTNHVYREILRKCFWGEPKNKYKWLVYNHLYHKLRRPLTNLPTEIK